MRGVSWAASVTMCVTWRVPSSSSSSNSSANAGMNALYASTGIAPSSSSLVCGEPSTLAIGKARLPPTWSTCACVSTSRPIGRFSACTAAANGSHCDRTMRVSITVTPSSSTTTPALLTPDSPPGCNHTYTPSAISCSVRGRITCLLSHSLRSPLSREWRGPLTIQAQSWSRRRLPPTLTSMSERSRNLPRRSCHATPGSNEKMLGKAPGLGADQVFLDLEDSVSPLEKEAARAKVVRAINESDWGDTVLCVRVNAWDTEWTYRDVVTVCEQSSERLDEIMLPKVQSAAEVQALDMLLTQIERVTGRTSRIGIEAQIETARGLINVEEICAASDRLETIIFGPADFAASTEMPVLTGGVQIPEYPGDHFHYVFSKILMAGRANGLQVIDGPYLKIRDLDGLRDYAMRTRILGYDGKWSLHPDQVGVINEVYTPTQEQFDHAWDLLEAYEKATTEGERRGAVMFGDEMIDEASSKMATKFVSRGERAGMSRSAT